MNHDVDLCNALAEGTANIWTVIGTSLLLAILIACISVWVSIAFVRLKKKNSKANERREEKLVRSTSLLYKELQKLNQSEQSIVGKVFAYTSTHYVLAQNREEWFEYDIYDFLVDHQSMLEDDLHRLNQYNKDLSTYESSVAELWKKYGASPESIAASQIPAERYSLIEEAVCKDFLISIPCRPVLEYRIIIKNSADGEERDWRITQAEVEEFLRSEKAKEAPIKPDKPIEKPKAAAPAEKPVSKKDSVKLESNPQSAAVQKETPKKKEEQSKTPAPVEAKSERPTENKEEQKRCPIITDESFNRFFESIDDLDDSTCLWETLSEDEQPIVRYVTYLVFVNKADLIPLNQIGIFGFRLRRPGDIKRSVFWFRKIKGNPLTFCYRTKDTSFDSETIEATQQSWKLIEKAVLAILSLLDDEGSKALSSGGIRSAVEKALGPASQEKKDQETDTKTSIQTQPAKDGSESTLDVKTEHDSVLAKYPQLNLENPSLFYGKQIFMEQQVIDKTLIYATSLSEKIVPQNGPSTFGFGHADDLENGYSWFGFRKRIGEGLTFFFKNNRYISTEGTTVANQYQIDVIKSIVKRVVNIGLSTPSPVNNQSARAVSDELSSVGKRLRDYLANLRDPERFFFNCTPDEKELIIKVADYSLKLDKEISFGNPEGYFGYKKRWGKGKSNNYWYWFRKRDGKYFEFIYRESPSDKQTTAVPIDISDDHSFEVVRNIVLRLHRGKTTGELQKPRTPAQEVAVAPTIVTQPKYDDNLAISIAKPGYFFERISAEEQALIVSVIRFVKQNWPAMNIENTKNFLGFRFMMDAGSSPFWFWFSKPAGSPLQFVSKKLATDSFKRTLNLNRLKAEWVARIIQTILPAPTKQEKESNISAINDKPVATAVKTAPTTAENKVSFWNRPYLYTAEIMKECKLKGTVATEDLSAICTLHHFTYGGGVAVNNKYRSFADAIYQSFIVNNPSLKIYVYSNPFNCQAYDKALLKLMDDLRIFDLGEGRYLTNKALQNDYGISNAECFDLRGKIQKYLSKHMFFSLDNLREDCSDCHFLEFSSSDKIFMQFIHSVVKRYPKVIITDRDSAKGVYTTSTGIDHFKVFFSFLMEDAVSMDIYAIRDRVETLFAINYDLDSIGKDSEKGGFYYSEDLEKVYKSKRYFYKEIEE